jgi:hypothetical protein
MPKSKTHAKRRAKQKGVQHDHSRYVPGCMRCELSKAEVKQINDGAKRVQAEEPKESYTIDDISGRA